MVLSKIIKRFISKEDRRENMKHIPVSEITPNKKEIDELKSFIKQEKSPR